MRIIQNEKGSIWIIMSFLIIFVWVSMAGVLKIITSQYQTMNRIKMSTAAFHLAEAGITKGLWELSKGNTGYNGERNTRLDIGTFTVDVHSKNGQFIITSTGYIPDRGHVRAKQIIRVVAERDEKGTYKIVTWQKL